MTSRLTHISVSNFRSISDEINVSLDAPIVLIHGPNGSGKTSLLSAIELALTGEVASLARIRANDVSRLINQEHSSANIKLQARYDASLDGGGAATIASNGLAAKPLLTKSDANFYRERCYLSQSALSRLLEIYEQDDSGGENPLSKFAQELLGLDTLDHLANGLFHLGHVSRIRKSVPLYEENETALKNSQRLIERLEQELAQTRARIEALSEDTLGLLDLLSADEASNLDERIEKLPNEEDEEARAAEALELRREISSAISMLNEATRSNQPREALADLEQKAATAAQKMEQWDQQYASAINGILSDARAFRADLAGPESVGYLHALEETKESLEKELVRRQQKIAEDAANRERAHTARSAKEKNEERERRLGARIDDLAGDESDLAKLLARLQDFVDGDICPVCSRDFSEISDIPFKSHLSEHISKLVERSQELQQLIADRKSAINAAKFAAQQELDAGQNLLNSNDISKLRSDAATIEEIIGKIELQKKFAATGDDLNQESSRYASLLFENRKLLETHSQIRILSQRFEASLGLTSDDSLELEVILQACYAEAEQRQEYWQKRLSVRSGISRKFAELTTLRQLEMEQENQRDGEASRAESFEAALKAAKSAVRAGKAVVSRVEIVRSEIVQKVFTETLNRVWKDLFVRLAPDERFIPAFGVEQDAKKRAVATLQTLYRGKAKSGNPRTMLSAGNLNTAALTLFLSLHLSVSERLPWLVIDDPVQSMDEIHVAQFAALLRTLSRQHNKQIIIAVHERPLFDYLALELSPASEEDRLVTIELSRLRGRATSADYQIKTWDPDTVLQFPKAV